MGKFAHTRGHHPELAPASSLGALERVDPGSPKPESKTTGIPELQSPISRLPTLLDPRQSPENGPDPQLLHAHVPPSPRPLFGSLHISSQIRSEKAQ